MAGTPQIICSGDMFERKYNAESMCKIGAGILLEQRELTAKRIVEFVNEIEKNQSYKENAKRMGVELQGLGGADQIVKYMEKEGNS